MKIADLVKELDDHIKDAKINYSDVAYLSDMQPSHISRIVAGKGGEPRFSTLEKIYAACGYELQISMVKSPRAAEKLAVDTEARAVERTRERLNRIGKKPSLEPGEFAPRPPMPDPVAEDAIDPKQAAREQALRLTREMKRAADANRAQPCAENEVALLAAARAMEAAGWTQGKDGWLAPGVGLGGE